MADFADSLVAEATSTDPLEHAGALGQDGDNKFQKAISAWRSMSSDIFPG
jgi:homeobox protein cut-like